MTGTQVASEADRALPGEPFSPPTRLRGRTIAVLALVVLLVLGAVAQVAQSLTTSEDAPPEPAVGRNGRIQAADLAADIEPPADVATVEIAGGVRIPVPPPWSVQWQKEDRVMVADGEGDYVLAMTQFMGVGSEGAAILGNNLKEFLKILGYKNVGLGTATLLQIWGDLTSLAQQPWMGNVKVDQQGVIKVAGQAFGAVRKDGLVMLLIEFSTPPENYDKNAHLWKVMVQGAVDALAGGPFARDEAAIRRFAGYWQCSESVIVGATAGGACAQVIQITEDGFYTMSSMLGVQAGTILVADGHITFSGALAIWNPARIVDDDHYEFNFTLAGQTARITFERSEPPDPDAGGVSAETRELAGLWSCTAARIDGQEAPACTAQITISAEGTYGVSSVQGQSQGTVEARDGKAYFSGELQKWGPGTITGHGTMLEFRFQHEGSSIEARFLKYSGA